MLGKEDLKSPGTEISGDISGNLNVLFTDSDDGTEPSHEGLVEEEKVEEIMQELYKEITLAAYSSNTSPPTTVTFPSPPPPPFLSPLTFFPANDVKISESCGASMSDSSSTVMAGVEFVGPTKRMPDVKAGSPPVKELWVTEREVDDDQWLARVLGWGPLELEEWT
ncbi:hypothetical protein V6N13_144921 [Hibiscus sabdariffa]|uniref:Uncharacterized protein n=1 Tax=Hibiscus sabdariffa TaxID=183260 RepID=A0ABR2FLT1_9ROSI